MSQCINHPTRQNNTLDLLLTNNKNSIIHTSAEDSRISDHKIVTIKAILKARNSGPIPESKSQKHSFRNLDLYGADYDQINRHLCDINWELLRSSCSQEEFPELFYLTVLQTCEIYCKPKKNHKQKQAHPRKANPKKKTC